MKGRRTGRFPALVALGLIAAACSPSAERAEDRFILRAPPQAEDRARSQRTPPSPGPRPPAEQAAEPIRDPNCAQGVLAAAARANAASLTTLSWTPFGRPETGWETYAPLVTHEIGTSCPPASPRFADALADWQGDNDLPRTGVFDPATFLRMKAAWHARRPVAAAMRARGCPPPPPAEALATARPEESYGGKTIQLRKDALAAYRRMVQAAKAEQPAIDEDSRNLTIFSGYRSPEYDDARCARDRNCDGVVRARCSPHRTGLALDLYVGQAPGYGPDSSADPNRLYMTRTATYAWLVANARRFGFTNYPFEPWHWEWSG